jgi:chromosome segregation ATPase
LENQRLVRKVQGYEEELIPRQEKLVAKLREQVSQPVPDVSAESQTSTDKIESLTARDLKDKVRELVDLTTMLEEEVASNKDSIGQKVETIYSLQDELKNREESVEELRKQLSKESAALARSQQEISELHDNAEKLSRREDRLLREIRRLKDLQLDETETADKLEVVRQDRDRLRSELQVVESQLQQLKKNCEDKHQDGAVHDKIEATEIMHEPVVEEDLPSKTHERSGNSLLQDALTASRNEIERLENDIAQLHQCDRERQEVIDEMSKQIVTLQTERDECLATCDDLTSERNGYKMKASSLARDMEKVLQSRSELQPPPKVVRQSTHSGVTESSSGTVLEVKRLREETQEQKVLLEAYKNAFEQQLAKSKKEQLRANYATQATSTDYQVVLSKNVQLEQLANTLAESLTERDESISHLQSTNQLLNERIQELETKSR